MWGKGDAWGGATRCSDNRWGMIQGGVRDGVCEHIDASCRGGNQTSTFRGERGVSVTKGVSLTHQQGAIVGEIRNALGDPSTHHH